MKEDLDDVDTGNRIGPWMQTYSGKRFFPQDMRAEDFCVDDFANGNALDCRYNGQGRVTKFYSVAEHEVHGAKYALKVLKDPELAWCFLFHDAGEGYLKDQARAVKQSLNVWLDDGLIQSPYKNLESSACNWIWFRVGCLDAMFLRHEEVKEIDNRLIVSEKKVLMKVQLPWAADALEPLKGVSIRCWSPLQAKKAWADMYFKLAPMMGHTPEEITFD